MSVFDKSFLSTMDKIKDYIIVDQRKFYFKTLLSTEGKKSVVWKVSDKFNNLYALKLATFEDYVDRSFDQEIMNASKLNNYSVFARIYGAEIKEFDDGTRKIKCVAFIEEWVDGSPLKDIRPEFITIPFIIKYINQLCNVLNILKQNKLRHDDLHDGNILIVKPNPGVLQEDLEIKVIDLGSVKDYYSILKPIKRGIDDIGNFALHVKLLLNGLQFLNNGERRILNSKEILFIEESRKLLNSIVDNDKGRALTKPSLIINSFQSAYSNIFSKSLKDGIKLGDPFDYIAAEQISDDQLLIKLFAESCPWVNEITSPNPILLTGPRGCGKSMLFRRYSLKALLVANDKLLDDIQIVGFYISCSADLSNRLCIINSQNQAKHFKEEIIHYFNLILLKEILTSLKLIIERPDSFEKFGINEIIQKDVFRYLTNLLRITPERKLSLQGVSPIEHLYELVVYEANYTYSQLVKKNKIKEFTTFSFISDVTRFLTNKIEYFKNRKITFLLDDYSLHRIPNHVQSLLNVIIWDRQSSHIFKVSSEKYGTTRNMINNLSADLSREYTEIDIGRAYINLSETGKEIKKFSSELLNNRLRLADYVGTAETLIGNSEYEEGSLGKQIFSGNKSNEFYHGLDTISFICSGDISTLLEIYRTIFRDAAVNNSTDILIPKSKQHYAITTSSKNFLELTKSFHPLGDEMYSLVVHFGNLCKKILVDGKPQRDSRTGLNVPNETTRIEIEEAEVSDQLSEANDHLYKELIRRAIFIELEPSRGRHTLGITNRLQLRRIYNPSFGLSLVKNTAIKWSQSEFKAFLNDPKIKCENEYINRWKKEDNQTSKDIQSSLFDEIQ